APGRISSTADGWSADTTKAVFLGMTVHWIDVKDAKWKMQSEVVGFKAVSGDHDNALTNTTICLTVEDLHQHRRLNPWDAFTNQLLCLEHVVNLANIDVMAHITKIAAVEMATAIWEYDPEMPANRVFSRSLDVIATIRTLAIKIQSSGPHIECFQKLQLECNILHPHKIPLHSNV
ncbi:hypothetical protein L208DRAFT_1123454, partial [Tricholoma matsutake]